jgi:hypothetical protein
LRLAKPPPCVEDEADDQRRSPERGGPDPDSMADEPCNDDREQDLGRGGPPAGGVDLVKFGLLAGSNFWETAGFLRVVTDREAVEGGVDGV